MTKRVFTILLLMVMIISSCIYPFEPEIKGGSNDIISIEGDIICGDTSVFYLTSSLRLDEPNNSLKSLMAQKVYVQNERGDAYNAVLLKETNKDYLNSIRYKYVVDTRDIDVNSKYRLVVEFNNDSIYVSSFTPILQSPPIDSITFKVAEDRHSVSIKVNSVGDLDSTMYFMWKFEENWEFTSRYYAEFEYEPITNTFVEIPYHDNHYWCWKHSQSSNILVFSTEKLEKNRVNEFLIHTIDYSDDRVSILYCITVTQSLLSRDGYNYWSTLKKNNDNTGGIFSPQPSELRGNIELLADTTELVIGFISAYKSSTLRKFISSEDLRIYKDFQICSEDTIPEDTKWLKSFKKGRDFAYYDRSGTPIWSSRRCVDCREEGTKTKPSFWPGEINYE